MKCIMSVKPTKNVEVGVIRRVSDKDADSEVKGGYWKYVPKSEYKKQENSKKVTKQNIPENDIENVKKPNKTKNTKTSVGKKSK